MIYHQFFRYKYAKTFASGILTAAWKNDSAINYLPVSNISNIGKQL